MTAMTNTAAIQEHFYTADALLEWSHLPENDLKRFELSQGRLIEMSPAGLEHGSLTAWLGRLIGNFADENALGLVTAAETGFILHTDADGRDTVRAPDVGFIAAARLPDDLPSGYAPFAPDLAIEVVSPNDRADEIEAKIAEYLQYGTRLVWVFYPRTRRVAVHSPAGVKTLTLQDTLDGEDVLPGFKLAVREVFGK